MPIFREYRLHCTINGSWITSRSATAQESRLLPRCKKPLATATSTLASGRCSTYPDKIAASRGTLHSTFVPELSFVTFDPTSVPSWVLPFEFATGAWCIAILTSHVRQYKCASIDFAANGNFAVF